MSRRSRQRDTILKVVINTKTHPRADWVYEQVRKEIPNISLGTVYRNLKSLAEAGEISQLELAGSTSRFDGNMDNHYHFRCRKCGDMYDLDEPVDRSIEKRIAQKTGFKITQQHLELLGLCTKCQ
jgi:Fur family transcriptional regulator, peroxide stress response regulator